MTCRRLKIFCVAALCGLALALPAAHAAAKPKTLPVELRVDFGPAGKPPRAEKLEVTRGSTPKDAVSMVFAVMSGYACCDTRDVIGIDGTIINPAENLWWVCEVNGDRRKVSPQKTKLKAGDVIQWAYVADAQ